MGLLLQLEHQRNITSYEGEVIIPLKTVDDRLVILNESGLTLRPSHCSEGIAGVLLQEEDEGLNPVFYYSFARELRVVTQVMRWKF